MIKLVIEGRLVGLNEYINANRNNRYKGNCVKKTMEEIVGIYINKCELKPITKYPINLDIKWYEKDMRRDADNIFFASKFILDALTKNKIIINDSRKYIRKIDNEVLVDKDNPRIEVEILEM